MSLALDNAPGGDRSTTSYGFRSVTSAGTNPQEENQQPGNAERAWQDDELEEFERSIYVVNITHKDFEDLIGSSWRQERPNRLDFSADRYRLESLGTKDGPDSRRGLLVHSLNKQSLTSLDISMNRLFDISCLSKANGFQALSILLARFNLIFRAELDLPRLLELNLSHNKMTTLPNISGVPQLECLVVSHNQLTGTFAALRDLNRLKRLDVSFNKYDLCPSELGKSLRMLSATMVELRLFDNPFVACFKEYQIFVIRILGSLTKLDNVRISESLRSDVKRQELMTLDCYDDIFRKRKIELQERLEARSKKSNDEESGYPRLQYMMAALEEILEDTSTLIANVHKVVATAHNLAAQKSHHKGPQYDVEKVFWTEMPEPHYRDPIVAHLLELLVSIMERHDSVRGPLMKVLGALTCAVDHHLGQKCMATLGRMMVTSEVYRSEVQHTLGEVVIPLLEAHTDMNKYDHTRTIVEGLVELLKNKSIKEDVVEAMGSLVPMLARRICAASELKDASLGVKLLAYSDKTGCAKQIQPEDLQQLAIKVSAAIDSRSIAEHESLRDLWLDLLRLASNLVRECGDEVIQKFQAQGIHVKVISRAKNIEAANSAQNDIREARTLSTIIDFVAALMEKSVTLTRDCCTSYHLMELLCQILKQPNIDPLVLASSCRALRVALCDPKTFVMHIPRVNRDLDRIKPLLAVLGGSRYPHLFIRSKWHELGKNGSELSAEELQRIDMQSKGPMERYNCEVANEAMLAVIELVDFFANAPDNEEEAAQDHRNQVNSALDEAGREQIMLKLLVMDSDDIKHAVIKCISNVPLEQIQLEEMGLIIKRLAMTQNIGEGRMEETLAMIVLYLTKLVSNDGEAGRSFRRHFAAVAISETYALLHRNSERSTYDDSEEDQKLLLSKAIVDFFIVCSRYPPLQDYFVNPSIEYLFPRILKNEEEKNTPTKADVSLEFCWTARSFDNLIGCLHGPNALHRSKKVALRVLCRVADVLEGSTDMTRSYVIADVAAREAGMDLWEQRSMEKRLRYLSNKDADFRRREVDNFITFNALREVFQFVRDPNSGDRARKHHAFMNAAKEKREKLLEKSRLELEEKTRVEQEAKQKDDPEFVDMEEEDQNEYDVIFGREVMMQAIQRFEDRTDSESQSLFGQPHPDLKFSSRLFEDESTGIVAKSYGIAAVLRMLHALIVVPPEESCRATVVSELRTHDLAMELLILIEDIPITECNVVAKFFRVMSNAIETCANGNHKDANASLELLYMLSMFAKRVAQALLSSLRLCKDAAMAPPEQILCAEMAHFMDTMLNVVPLYEFSIESAIQFDRVKECIDWLVPPVITRLMIAIVTYDIQMDHGGGAAGSISHSFVKQAYGKMGMKEYASSFLSKLVVRCDHHKYDVLEAFSVSSIFEHMSMRASFLAEFLGAVNMRKYMLHVEDWIRSSQDGSSNDRILHMALVKTPQCEPFALLCLTSGSVYLVEPAQDFPPYADDDIAGGWDPSWEVSQPRDPKFILALKYAEIDCIHRLYGTQLMAIERKRHLAAFSPTVANGGQPPTRRQWIFAFPKANDCDICISIMQRSTATNGKECAPIKNDWRTHDDVVHVTGNDRRIAATLAMEATPSSVIGGLGKKRTEKLAPDLSLFVLTMHKLIKFSVHLDAWKLPPEDDEPFLDADDFSITDEVPGHGAQDRANEFVKRARDDSRGHCLKKAWEQNLSLAEIGFETTADAVLSLQLQGTVNINFFDDSGREQWRRALAYVIASGTTSWKRYMGS